MKTISEMSQPYALLDVNAYGCGELDIEINLVYTDNWKELIESILTDKYLPATMVRNLIDEALRDNHAFAYSDTDKLISINIVDRGSK